MVYEGMVVLMNQKGFETLGENLEQELLKGLKLT